MCDQPNCNHAHPALKLAGAEPAQTGDTPEPSADQVHVTIKKLSDLQPGETFVLVSDVAAKPADGPCVYCRGRRSATFFEVYDLRAGTVGRPLVPGTEVMRVEIVQVLMQWRDVTLNPAIAKIVEPSPGR